MFICRLITASKKEEYACWRGPRSHFFYKCPTIIRNKDITGQKSISFCWLRWIFQICYGIPKTPEPKPIAVPTGPTWEDAVQRDLRARGLLDADAPEPCAPLNDDYTQFLINRSCGKKQSELTSQIAFAEAVSYINYLFSMGKRMPEETKIWANVMEHIKKRYPEFDELKTLSSVHTEMLQKNIFELWGKKSLDKDENPDNVE